MDLASLLQTLQSPRTIWSVLWVGFAVLSVAVLILMQTRWGHARPLSKCVVLSVFAHILLLGYAYTTELFTDLPPGQPEGTVIQVRVTPPHDPADDAQASAEEETAWDKLTTDSAVQPLMSSPDRLDLGLPEVKPQTAEVSPAVTAEQPTPAALDDGTRPPETAAVERADPPARPGGVTAMQIDAPQAQRRDPTEPLGPGATALARAGSREQPVKPDIGSAAQDLPEELFDVQAGLQRLADLPESLDQAQAVRSPVDDPNQSSGEVQIDTEQLPRQRSDPQAAVQGEIPEQTTAIATADIARADIRAGGGEMDLPIGTGVNSQSPSPEVYTALVRSKIEPADATPLVYQLRSPTARTEIAQRLGATVRTEAAVELALKWLAEHQQADGRWDSRTTGGGRENSVAGHDRQGAGAQADTGITGLTLLAFMAAGHTHLEGKYRQHVQHGLEYLIRSQAPDGNLIGPARTFAAMYCHGMASLALSEAFAVTGDQRLRPFVEQAVGYSIRSQNKQDGGWRYRPGDRGDMSQFGWQLMSLKSAELAGVEVPEATRQGMRRFLESASTGAARGLAGYRPGERASRTMTAEALLCRYFLDGGANAAAVAEATAFISEELPADGKANLYYWYYGTLAMHQTQGEAWQRWNQALQDQLLARQITTGVDAGSYSPDTIWGGYGGRVYSTALATLSLEVYYRYLPILVADRVRDAAPPR